MESTKVSKLADIETEAVWYQGLTLIANKVKGTMALKGDTFSFSDQAGNKLLELPVSDIARVSFSVQTIGIKTTGIQKQKLQFAFATGTKERTAGVASPSVLGLLMINHAQGRGGFYDWMLAFQSRGIVVKNYLR